LVVYAVVANSHDPNPLVGQQIEIFHCDIEGRYMLRSCRETPPNKSGIYTLEMDFIGPLIEKDIQISNEVQQ